MWHFDKAKLQAELRRDMAERREAIAARQRQLDANRIEPKPPLIFKTLDNARVRDDTDVIDEPSSYAISDWERNLLCTVVDFVHQKLAEAERPLTAEISELRGRVETLTAMLDGADGVRSARSTRRAKAKERGHD